jgi:acyl carrier protein
MNITDFVKNFENAIEGIPVGSISPDTEFRQLEQWDSLAALTIMAMVNAEYDVELAAEELKNSKTIEDIFRVVAAKKQ